MCVTTIQGIHSIRWSHLISLCSTLCKAHWACCDVRKCNINISVFNNNNSCINVLRVAYGCHDIQPETEKKND